MLGFFKDGIDLKLIGFKVMYGDDRGAWTPYMTRFWIGRLKLHIFHRGDADPDCHDHPWDFWTFPLTPYVEEVARDEGMVVEGFTDDGLRRPEIANGEHSYDKFIQVVPAFRWSFRPATHCHRVLGRWNGRHIRLAGYAFGDEDWPHYDSYDAMGDPKPVQDYYPATDSRKIVTLVWVSPKKRDWGFLRNRDGKWCWIAWRDYVFNGGKEGPCE